MIISDILIYGPYRGIPRLIRPPKRKIFISYHHANDQGWYDLFSTRFSEAFELFYDNSLERKEDSTNSEYLNRKIREEYIFGTSVTIVLCGLETWKRRWVDWEIHATLEYKHGLFGIVLPTCHTRFNPVTSLQDYIVPKRLYENIESGYAPWTHWTNDVITINNTIEEAVRRSSFASLIRNGDIKMKKSLA
jgi:hypothetical protein